MTQCPTCHRALTRVGKFLVCPDHGSLTPEPSAAPIAPARHPQQVFISYGRADAMAFAQRLAADLKERGGHHVWLDLECIETGAGFEVRIERGIRNSDVVAAVMTTRSVAEDSVCRDEVVFALNEGKTVVPLRADASPAAKPTLLLARRNWIDPSYALFHRSLQEWLSDRQAAGRYWCDASAAHARMAEVLQDRWREDEYALRYLPGHLASAAQWDAVAALLTDLGFLEAKVAAGFPFLLARDFAEAV